MNRSGMRQIINLVENSNSAEFSTIVKTLHFLPTSKKAIGYEYFARPLVPSLLDQMPHLSYGFCEEPMTVVTHTSDGKETTNQARAGDSVISGSSGEKYVVRAEKLLKQYQGHLGETLVPDQTPRMVASYGPDLPSTTLVASWGDTMPVHPGDYVVQDGPNNYYRIAKKEYLETYNPPGVVG
jgi:hypothetical protein